MIADRNAAVLVLGAFAVVQIVNCTWCTISCRRQAGSSGLNMLSTIFTVVFVAIAIAGTLWVMFHMNANMMPDHRRSPRPRQMACRWRHHHAAPDAGLAWHTLQLLPGFAFKLIWRCSAVGIAGSGLCGAGRMAGRTLSELDLIVSAWTNA